jgi:hypothetical protein
VYRQVDCKSILKSPTSYLSSIESGFNTRQNTAGGSLTVRHDRARPKFVYIEPESSDEEAAGAFTANPAEDLPKNKLTEKLARGLQTYVKRMQEREGFRAEVRI